MNEHKYRTIWGLIFANVSLFAVVLLFYYTNDGIIPIPNSTLVYVFAGISWIAMLISAIVIIFISQHNNPNDAFTDELSEIQEELNSIQSDLSSWKLSDNN